jgi:hypothetical protein
LARRRLDPHLTAARLDDSFDDARAQPAAWPIDLGLGSKERLESARTSLADIPRPLSSTRSS